MNERIFTDIIRPDQAEKIDKEPNEEEPTLKEELINNSFELFIPIERLRNLLEETMKGENLLENLGQWATFTASMNESINHPNVDAVTKNHFNDLDRSIEIAHRLHAINPDETNPEEREAAKALMLERVGTFLKHIEENKEQFRTDKKAII